MIADRVLQGSPRAHAVPARRRARLPVAGPLGRHAVGRRGAAHPAGQPDRQRPGRRALRARRALDRPAPARQPAAHRHAGAAARPRQHRHRRRARRGDDPHGRLRRRHRAGRGGARRQHRPRRSGDRAAAACSRTRRPSPASTSRASSRSRCRPGAGRAPATSSTVRGAREHNLHDIDVVVPARVPDRGDRRVGLGQVDARQRHPAALAGAAAAPGQGAARAGTARSRACGTSTRWSTSTRRRSAARRGRTRPPTPASSTTSASSSPRRPRPRCAATSPAASRSTCAAGAARPAPGDGTIKIEMHFLPDVYVPCEICDGARYNRDTLEITFRGKTIADVLDMSCEEALELLRAPAADRPAHADAGRRRPRLRAPGPAGADALGRRGAAGEAGERAEPPADRPHLLHPRRADDRAALRRHPQAARGAGPPGRRRATPSS